MFFLLLILPHMLLRELAFKSGYVRIILLGKVKIFQVILLGKECAVFLYYTDFHVFHEGWL